MNGVSRVETSGVGISRPGICRFDIRRLGIRILKDSAPNESGQPPTSECGSTRAFLVSTAASCIMAGAP